MKSLLIKQNHEKCKLLSTLKWLPVLSRRFLCFGKNCSHIRQVACEQASKWGIGRRQKSSSERGREREGGSSISFFLAPILRYFAFRPIPHLGACSQAIRQDTFLILIFLPRKNIVSDFSREEQTIISLF